MEWIVVEDECGPVQNLAACLFGLSGDDLYPVECAVTFLRERKGKRPELPSEWSWVLRDLLAGPEIGLRIGNTNITEVLWFIHVKCDESFLAARDWLKKSLPRACVTFLDYTLGLGDSGTRAEQIAPLVALDSMHLCYSSASTIDRLGASRTFGLSRGQERFCLGHGSYRLTENAKSAVEHARKFWEHHNTVFTEDVDVDGIIRMYIQANAYQWDEGRAFMHDTLEKADTSSAIAGMSYLPSIEYDDDTLKALFQRHRHSFAQDENGDKALTAKEIQALLKSLHYNCKVVYETNAALCPPFLPGIMFFCQLKLLLHAMSKSKSGSDRKPPTLVFGKYSKIVTVNFDSPLANTKDNPLITGIGGGDSTNIMRALRARQLGTINDVWSDTSAASCIAGLVRPSPPTSIIRTELDECNSNQLMIRWD